MPPSHSPAYSVGPWCPVQRIISGGQTGVDRAALNVAMLLHIEHGGWCPRGRLAEDGRIPEQYQLWETEAIEYSVRTECNVVDSTGTLLIYRGRLQRGTLLTYRLAQKHAKPALRVRLDQGDDIRTIQRWLCEHEIRVLNVAGPRASSQPEIAREAEHLLLRTLTTQPANELF
ncbi:MAG: putative molybdenum carrier protein [Pirellulaceae bacterium]|nr:putative molybdenum carrier protein [Pirellulaceae bacterium]